MHYDFIFKHAGHQALEQSPVITAVYDTSCNLVWANRCYREAAGVSQSELEGRKCYAVWGRAEPCSRCPAEECLQSGEPAEAELSSPGHAYSPEAQCVWMAKTAPLRDDQGRVIGIIEVVVDISPARQEEAALEENNRQLGERVKELNCLYLLSQLFADWSIPEQELLQRVVEAIPLSWQYPDIACARLIWNGQEFATRNFQETKWKLASDISVHRKDLGRLEVCYLEERTLQYEGPFLKEERSLIEAIVKNLSQNLEARHIKQEKSQSEEFSRAIIDSSPLPVLSLDLKGNVLTWNAAAERVLGWTADEVIGQPLPIVPEDKKEEFAVLRQQLVKEGGFSGLEVVRQRKDRQLIDVSLSTAAIHDQVGQVIGIMAFLEDITERKRAERALKETKENLRVTLNSIGDGVIATDTRGRITRMNPVAEQLTGWRLEQAANIPLKQVFYIVNAQNGEKAENPAVKVLSTGQIVGLANHTTLISRLIFTMLCKKGFVSSMKVANQSMNCWSRNISAQTEVKSGWRHQVSPLCMRAKTGLLFLPAILPKGKRLKGLCGKAKKNTGICLIVFGMPSWCRMQREISLTAIRPLLSCSAILWMSCAAGKHQQFMMT